MMKTFRPSLKPATLLFAAAACLMTLAGCGAPETPSSDLPDSTSQTWVRTDRGYVWCLASRTYMGHYTTDCDWSTLTQKRPEHYTDVRHAQPESTATVTPTVPAK